MGAVESIQIDSTSIRDQYWSAETTSPPAQVTRAAKVGKRDALLDEPDRAVAQQEFAPPGWKAKIPPVPSVT